MPSLGQSFTVLNATQWGHLNMNDIDIKQLRVIIYLRKSSDSEDKQVASIPQQHIELTQYAMKHELHVVDIIEESHSAFHPKRPKFDSMMRRIEAGEADAVLAWNATRIARNTVDGGMFIYMLDMGQIKAFITKGKVYTNTPEDKFTLNIDFSVAKKSSDDLSVVVHRGNRHKFYEKREWGGMAKPGYRNFTDPLTKENKIENDSERFTIIKNALQLVATGTNTPMEALAILNNSWGYRSRITKKQGGLPMSKTSWYRILNDPFYCGLMKRKVDGVTQEIVGTHESMITEDEFELLQVRLGGKGKTRASKKVFAFKEVLRCGECQGTITAEEKWQIICSQCKKKFHKGINTDKCPQCHILIEKMHNPKILHYVFYHCTKRVHPHCTQGSITLDNLEKKIKDKLSKFKIKSDYKDWAINYLNELNDIEEIDQKSVKNNLITRLSDVDQELRGLLRLRIRPRNVETDPEREKYYDTEESRLFNEKKKINKAIKEADKRQENWYYQSKETFNFAYSAKYRFAKGDAKEKTYILSKLGSNLVIKDKELQISGDKAYFLIEKGKKEIASIVDSLEPAKQAEIASNLLAYEPISQAWRRRWDLNPRSPKAHAFQACGIDRYPTPPNGTYNRQLSTDNFLNSRNYNR